METIGEAVVRKLSGATIRAMAEALGLPSTTVRDWLSRYHERAPALGRGLTAWAIGQGLEIGRLDVDDDRRAAAALGAAWHAWCRRPGRRPLGPWRLLGPDHRREGPGRQHEPALPVQRGRPEDGHRVPGPAAVARLAGGGWVLLGDAFEFNATLITIERCRIVTIQFCRFVCK